MYYPEILMSEEMSEVSLLYSEPDIMLKVFLLLDLKDLSSVEGVCKNWREFGENIIFTIIICSESYTLCFSCHS